MKKFLLILLCLIMISNPLLAENKKDTAVKILTGFTFMGVGVWGISIGTIYSAGTGVYFLLKSGKIIFKAGTEYEK